MAHAHSRSLSDPAVFRDVFDEHARRVYAAAVAVLGDPVLAQDVVQDVFLRLWRRPGAFDPARGELGSYLRLIARSRALDLLREARSAERAGERLRAARPGDAATSSALDWVAAVAEVRAAVCRLPARQREAIVLAYWGGLTAEEVAREIGAPVGTTKSRIRLGLRRLRREWDGAALARPEAA